MIKEEKTIFVSVLTVLLLGFSNFLQTSKLLFTFPINDYLLLVVAIYLVFTSLRNHLGFSFVLLSFCLTNLLSNLYNYEFLFNQEQLTWMSNSIITDVFHLSTYLLYLILLFLIYRHSNEKSMLLILLSTILMITLTECYSFQALQLITYLLPLLWLTFFAKKLKESFYITYLLLFLHVFLLSTKFYTLYIA